MESFVTYVLWGVYLLSLYFAVLWFLVFLDKGLEEEKKKQLQKHPFVTIVIPAYNEMKREDTGEVRAVITETIRTTMQIDYPQDKFEVIIINDGSTDATSAVIKKTIKEFPGRNITFIDKKKNEGKWAAMNDALALAKGEYFISMDGDSLLPKNILKEMLPYFSSKKVACVMPNMKVMAPKRFIEKVQWYEYIVNMYYKKLMSRLDCVHVAPGPFSVFRTDIVRKIGGYRPGYNTEDLEITLRLQKEQYKVIQALDVDVFTKAPPNFKAWYRQRNRWFRGATMNAMKTHKDMIFSKKHGDFGMIQMPTILISGILGVILVLTTLYYFFKPYATYFWNMHYVNFDFLTFLKDITPDFHILDLNFMNVTIMIITICIATATIFIAHRASRESVRKQGFFALAFFFMFYYLLMGFAWLGVCFDMARGKKYRW
jgi:cellulose synthase/poly-beta-1,6-N-acetylglucosamine synthase-like glycosyltransferase